MGSMLYWAIGGGIVLCLLFFTPQGRRIWSAIAGQFSKGSWWLWKRDPVAIIQGRIDSFTATMQKSQEKMEDYNGKKIEAEQEVNSTQVRCTRTEAKITNLLAPDGVTFTDEAKALEYQIELSKLEKDLAYKKEVRDRIVTGYKTNLAKFKQAQKDINKEKEDAGRLADELDLSKVDVATSRMTQELDVGELSNSELKEAKKELQLPNSFGT